MTQCKQRRSRPVHEHFAMGVSILLLAISVFGWGLHSKLSLYQVRSSASITSPIAKLLSERERPADQAQHCTAEHIQLNTVALYAAVISLPRPARHFQQRRDATPVQPVAFSFDGPSLLRPPPSSTV